MILRQAMGIGMVVVAVGGLLIWSQWMGQGALCPGQAERWGPWRSCLFGPGSGASQHRAGLASCAIAPQEIADPPAGSLCPTEDGPNGGLSKNFGWPKEELLMLPSKSWGHPFGNREKSEKFSFLLPSCGGGGKAYSGEEQKRNFLKGSEASKSTPSGGSASGAFQVQKSDQQWQKLLTPLQYYVTRQKGTEPPFTGQYWNCTKPGVYRCVCCGAELFSSEAKFLSKSGWPSFWQPIRPEAVETQPDHSHGMIRTEVLCRRCGAHLGHVFEDGPPPTGLRYCINSAALRLEEKSSGSHPGGSSSFRSSSRPAPESAAQPKEKTQQ